MLVRRLPPVLFLFSGLVPAGAACTATTQAPTRASEAVVERNCIHEAPITEDGYTSFATVDPALVTRKIFDPAQGLVDDPQKVVSPTDDQVQAAMRNVNAYITKIDEQVPGDIRRHEVYSNVHRGEAMEPYCLFHKPGTQVYGTVVFFHGFNDRPLQQAKHASYLFHAGYNVYNVFLANHYMVQGKDFWPKTSYRADVLAALQAKFADPANQATLAPIVARLQADNGTQSQGGAITPDDVAALDSVLRPEYSVEMLQQAWQTPGSDAYKALFNWNDDGASQNVVDAARQSDFFEFVRDARARLADLDPMPGPIFVSGLSVGGAMSLALGAADGGRRVHGIFAQAPWLDSIDPNTTQQISFVGPLDQNVTAVGGQYPIVWPNHNIQMSPANIAANLALGAWTTGAANVQTLATIPTALITSASDDSADNRATATLHGAFTSNAAVAALHVAAQYPASLGVGHAMTDPENYPDGGLWNQYWRTLYQESDRFFLTGTIDTTNLLRRDQDPSLPQVVCRTPDYPGRCP